MTFKILSKNILKKKTNEIGRSMVEILGVLSIIGVLSIGSLEAFKYAIDKKISNDLWKSVKLHASVTIIDHEKDLNTFDDGEEIPVEISEEQLPFQMRVIKNGHEDGFIVDAYSVTRGVCLRTLDMGNADIELITISEERADNTFGDEIEFNGNSAICSFETQRMSFYFSAPHLRGEAPECPPSFIRVDGICQCPECHEEVAGRCNPTIDTETCCVTHGFRWQNDSCFNGCEEGEQTCVSGDDTWCCAEGRGCGARAGECCVGQFCCTERHTPWCKTGSYDVACFNEECCNGDVTIFEDGTEYCCPENQTAYCATFDEDGNCTGYGCSENDVYCNTTYADGSCQTQTPCANGEVVEREDGIRGCCPSGQTPYCRSYDYSTGECTAMGCCSGSISQVEGIDACCNSESTPYCNRYNTTGKCYSASCSSSTCTPYCSTYTSTTSDTCSSTGDCCTGEIKRYGRYNRCCNSGQGTPYCTSIDTDGSCSSSSCCTGEIYCASYSNGKCTKEACCSGKVTEIGGKKICCPSGETAYCQSYDADGKCISQQCCSGNPYCTAFNLDTGKCMAHACCSGSVYCYNYTTGGDCTSEACCTGSLEPYCHLYDDEGECLEMACCKGIIQRDEKGRKVCTEKAEN